MLQGIIMNTIIFDPIKLDEDFALELGGLIEFFRLYRLSREYQNVNIDLKERKKSFKEMCTGLEEFYFNESRPKKTREITHNDDDVVAF